LEIAGRILPAKKLDTDDIIKKTVNPLIRRDGTGEELAQNGGTEAKP